MFEHSHWSCKFVLLFEMKINFLLFPLTDEKKMKHWNVEAYTVESNKFIQIYVAHSLCLYEA